MTPTKFTIRGSLGVLAGLGRDELTIDLADTIPEDALTVALRGDNGAGKSTILNLALTPWLNPPQVPGSMYAHFGPEGERLLEWSHGTEIYRSTIQYRQTEKTQTTKAVLHVRKGDSWQPMTLPDHTTSDGKTRTYNYCLAHILGPQSIYYLSAFRAQNAPRLADYDNPEELMTDLLSLDEPRDLAVKASAVRLQLDRALDGIKAEADTLAAKRERLGETSFEIDKLCASTAAAKDHKQVAVEAQVVAKAEYDHAVAESADLERIRKERGKVESRMLEREQLRKKDHRQIEASLLDLVERRQDIKSDAESATITIDSDISIKQELIVKRKAIIKGADKIHAAAAAIPGLEKTSAEITTELAALQEKLETKRALSIELTSIGHTLSTVLREGLSLKSRADDLKARAGYVDQVPCEGKAPYDTCPALQDAIQAASTALTVAAEREDKLVEYGLTQARSADKRKELDAMGDPEYRISELYEKQSQLQLKTKSTQQTAALLPVLESAETDIKQAEGQMAVLGERRARVQVEATRRAIECTKDESAHKARREDTQSTADKDIAALKAELDALPIPGESDAVDKAREVLSLRDANVAHAAGILESNTADIAHRKAERAGLERELKAGADVSERFERLTRERAMWYQLANGLRGVVKLSIEDAGPGIADIANRLLREAYGPRFTLKIVTQRQNKTNDTIKEVFDISVLDGDTGLESSIVHKSGGQNVIFDRCLTDAVGQHHQDVAGIQYETQFADEVDGALSKEKRMKFYQMERASLKLGGYKRKYFVSHAETAWDYADYIIDLGEYKVLA